MLFSVISFGNGFEEMLDFGGRIFQKDWFVTDRGLVSRDADIHTQMMRAGLDGGAVKLAKELESRLDVGRISQLIEKEKAVLS